MRLLAALAAAMLLGGCALFSSDQGTAASSGGADPLPRELSARPEPLLPAELPPVVTDEPEEDEERAEADEGSSTGGANGGGKGKEKKDGPEPADVFPPPPPGGQGSTSTRLLQVDDGAGDSGHDTVYADAVRLTVVETDDRAVVTVDAAGGIPDPLPRDEVMGVGVDLFFGTSRESDYQLFADGSDDGWYAYLHTPDGIVDFPGTFRLGGQRMVFEIPWSALGDPSSGRASAFADWSRTGGAALNPFSEDFVPDSGTRSFSR